MAISVFQLFSIGIGPSSSHTVGPMRAARQYVLKLETKGLLEATHHVKAELFGSLALTGKGHSTDLAILLGLSGETPDGVDPNAVAGIVAKIRADKTLSLLGKKTISFDETTDLLFYGQKQLPYHPNGMRFTAYDSSGKELESDVYYSVGGGFIIDHAAASKDVHLGEETIAGEEKKVVEETHTLPHPFKTADELLKICSDNNMMIADVMMANELTWRTRQEIHLGPSLAPSARPQQTLWVSLFWYVPNQVGRNLLGSYKEPTRVQ